MLLKATIPGRAEPRPVSLTSGKTATEDQSKQWIIRGPGKWLGFKSLYEHRETPELELDR